MAKKKRTVLPRLTVLAYNRRDLAAFVLAVEKLGLIAEDMRLLLNQIAKVKTKKVAATNGVAKVQAASTNDTSSLSELFPLGARR